jgi:hypothetical protein
MATKKKDQEETPLEAERRVAQEQTDDEDNSVLTAHEGYIGADPIYRNAADVTQEPQEIEGDPEAGVLDADLATELVDRVKENEEHNQRGVNQWGSGYNVEHPTEQVTANDKILARQREMQDAQLAAAKGSAPQAPQPAPKKDADTPKG